MIGRFRTIAAVALAATVALASGTAVYAAKNILVKVEFRFSGNKTVYMDIPVPNSAQVAEFCARELFYAQPGYIYMLQESDPSLAKAKFVGMKCVSEGGTIKTLNRATDPIPRQQPMANIAGVKLFFTDAKGKEVSKVYQERRARITLADCEEQFRSLTTRYKQIASQDKRFGKLTFLRSECVVLQTFDLKQAN